ncbi:Coiled-coil and C2 domain-containing protein 2A [Chamberlinius hualienensis]
MENSADSLVQQEETSVEDAYDFFTNQWPTEATEEHREAEPRLAEVEGENDRILVSDLLKLADKWQLLEFKSAKYQPFKAQLETETELYFTPSTAAIPLTNKWPTGRGLRNPADEGLYVGQSPIVPEAHRNKMEQRLIKYQGRNWLNEDDGRIKTVSDIIMETPGRPMVSQRSSENQTYYRSGLLSIAQTSDSVQYELELHISHVIFRHHYLFSMEHIVTSQLHQLYRQYKEIAKQGQIQFLNKKLEMLRSAIGGMRELKTERLVMYRKEISVVRKRLYEEGKRERRLINKLLVAWKNLKHVRSKQQFVSTTAIIKLTTSHQDVEEDERKWKEELQQEVRELEYESIDSGNSFDPEEATRLAEIKAKESRRPPGEPLITIHLIEQNDIITATDRCPRAEQRRRQEVATSEIYFKILYNDKLITQTDPKKLNDDFQLLYNESFRLLVTDNSSVKLTLRLCDNKNDLNTDIHLPLTNQNYHGSRNDGVEFSCDINSMNIMPPDSSISIGTDYDNDFGQLLTSGNLFADARWTDQCPNQQVAPLSGVNRGFNWNLITTKQNDWLCDLDPNDPDNAILIHQLQNGDNSLGEVNYFRLDHEQEEFNFATDDYFNNFRFRLIQLRQQQKRKIRQIPISDRFASLTNIQAYNPVVEEPVDDYIDDVDVDNRRIKALRYLNKIRTAVQLKYELANQRHHLLSDIISEEQVPNVLALGQSIYHGLSEKRRPLKPNRRERRTLTHTHNVISNNVVYLICNIANAFNVPKRKQLQHNLNLKNKNSNQMSSALTRPMVEISFQKQTVRTGCSFGSNPCWNQDLQLEFHPPNEDFSPTNLQRLTDFIYINLFDENIIDILADDRDRPTQIHQQIEKCYLASLHIPFATLYLNGRIEGTFKMDTPTVLIGYDNDDDVQTTPNGVYLTLFLTLEPSLTPTLHHMKSHNVESIETEQLLSRIEDLNKFYHGAFSTREAKMTVVDVVRGKSLLVTRYLRPIQPPETLTNQTSLARFVSLIPLLPEVVIVPGQCDLWTTNDHFLDLLVGDHSEHAVLLCNFFLHMKKDSWLLVGMLVPEGRCVCVLSKDNDKDGEMSIWIASRGQKFRLTDCFSPLQSVDCIIGSDNIWLNVQRTNRPLDMNFDLNSGKHWRSLFDSSFPNPTMNSVQPDSLTYKETSAELVDQLEKKIENHLRNEFMKWRKRFRTSWNRHCSHVLKNVLKNMEKRYLSDDVDLANDDSTELELQTILRAYKMNGFPLSMPYSGLQAISDIIESKGVHLTEGNDVEFALAVCLSAYCNNVIAVWVYVASLQKQTGATSIITYNK